MKTNRPPRNHGGTQRKFEPVPKKPRHRANQRWSPVHLIPIALLSTIAGLFIVKSCTDESQDWQTTDGTGGTGGGSHVGGWRGWGRGGSGDTPITGRGGFGGSSRSFFS